MKVPALMRAVRRRLGSRASLSDSIRGCPKMREVDHFDAATLEHQIEVKIVCQNCAFVLSSDRCDGSVNELKPGVDLIFCSLDARYPVFNEGRNGSLQKLAGLKPFNSFEVRQVANLGEDVWDCVNRPPSANLPKQQVEVPSSVLAGSLKAFNAISIDDAYHEKDQKIRVDQ